MVTSSQGLISEPLVLVPVPVTLVLGVYEYITASSRPGEVKGMTELSQPADTAAVQPRVDWTRLEDCQRLRAGLPGSPTIHALDYLAVHPGEFVGFGSLARASGLDRTQLRGRLAGLTMRIKSLWNIPRTEVVEWPMRPNYKSDPTEAHYVMTEEVARAWRHGG